MTGAEATAAVIDALEALSFGYITKLRWLTQGQRSKDVDDARGIIAVQGDRLDLTYIREWCERHGTSALLDEIRRSIPAV